MPDPASAARLRASLASARRLFRGILGADAYEKYLAHHERLAASGECSAPPMTEREFWRDKTDRQEANPQGRCC